MFRLFCSVALLAAIAPFTYAQYALVKIDLNQVNFSDLKAVAGGDGKKLPAKGVGGGPGIGVGAKQKDPLAPTEGPVWLYGCFELNAYNLPKKELESIQAEGEKTDKKDKKDKGQVFYQVKHHRWGNNAYFVFPKSSVIEAKYLDKPKLRDEYFTKSRAAKEPDDYLRLAYWCLRHCMYKEMDIAMSMMKKDGAERPAYQNYNRIKAELKKRPDADMPFEGAADLRAKGYHTIDSPEGHYRIYYIPQGPDFEINLKWRLSRMEEAYQNFFLWFALQENVQPPALPAYRLTVIVDTPLDFATRLKEAGVPPQDDGYTLREEGLVLLTSRPTGDPCHYLETNLSPMRPRLGLALDDLLKGPVTSGLDNTSLKMMQTLTVLQKVNEDEAMTLAISQECTRQLIGATGLISRNVAAPEWIQRGLVSFFEMPPRSLYPNFGLPRGSYLDTIKALHRSIRPGKKDSPKSGDFLLNTVSDNYFRQAAADLRLLRELDPKNLKDVDRKELQEKATESQRVARATAWSLVYYLAAQRKVDLLKGYVDWLNRLPRHAIVTPQTLQYCFAQAFDLADATDRTRIDNTKLQRFADGWLSYMAESVSPESAELEAFLK